MEALEGQPVRGPEGQVVEPDEAVDAETRVAVVPGDRAGQPTERPAARVLDAEDPDGVRRRASDDRAMPKHVVHGLEEGLREPVHGHVEEAARTAPPGVRADEGRVDRPPEDAVGEEPERGSGAETQSTI